MNDLPDTTEARPPVRRPVLLGLFAGTAVGAGYLLAGVPNVELMTLVAALAGAALGWRSGMVVGFLAEAIYSLGSPYGFPPPLILVGQVAGLGLAGLTGHAAAAVLSPAIGAGRRLPAAVGAAAAGVLATLGFDLLTNLGIVLAFETPPLVVLAGAVPFFLIHAGSNAVIFGTLFPLLLPRLAGLARPPLTGRPGSAAMVVAGAFLLACAPVGAAEAPAAADPGVGGDAVADTAAGPPVSPAPEPDPGPYRAFGWKRPQWIPFAPTGLQWADWYSAWLPVTDGGLGAVSVMLAEGGTDRAPLVVRDGVPLATGHVLADDPDLIPTQGLELRTASLGHDRWGGTAGRIEADTADPRPDRAYSRYRGIKGNHETYFRGIHVLTPRADWRAGFEFEESIDDEGYNFTDRPDDVWRADSGVEFPGHGKVRQSRTRLIRNLGAGDRLQIEYSNARKTKDSLPALGAEHLELWDDAFAATMDARGGRWQTRTVLFWRNRDVSWGERGALADSNVDRRLVETGREGFTFEMHRAATGPDDRPLTGLRLKGANWSVHDRERWPAGTPGAGLQTSGRGQEGLAAVHTGARLGASRLVVDLGGQWDSRAGLGPEAGLGLEQDRPEPAWRLAAAYGGRHARSDEYLTPLVHDVAGRELVLLPNPGLEREKSLRLDVLLKWKLLGLDLAIDASWRRLTRGIMWEPAGGATPDTGYWNNGLELDSSRVTGRLAREGRFLGWGRIMVEGTWRDFRENRGRAPLLPPEYDLRLHLMWENHFFQEDGIVQLALLSDRRGPMADPWDVTRSHAIPARSCHDLVGGLRLVGVHLTVAVRNLTGDRVPLTAGSLSPGREIDLRLNWGFHY